MTQQTLPTLGHVVFYVRNLKKSLDFYTYIVGLQHIGNIFNGKAAMLSGGSTHHELCLIEVGDVAEPEQVKYIGLYHVGWKVGDSLDKLKTVYQRIIKKNIEVDGMSDHIVSQSIYCRDPDGNEIELYVDNPEINWKEDYSWMDKPVKPLSLV